MRVILHAALGVPILASPSLQAGPVQRAGRPMAPRAIRRVIGASVSHRPIVAECLGARGPLTVILGAIHGNEGRSAAVVRRLESYLIAHPVYTARIRVILVPEVNPDGLRIGRRSNRRGVDLNRNFPGNWRQIKRPNTGSGPGSEPETRTVMNLIESEHPAKLVSIHAPLHCLIGCRGKGRLLAAAMARKNGYPLVNDVGYPTPGSLGQFCGARQIAMVTLELPRASPESCWRQNRTALLEALSWQTAHRDPTPDGASLKMRHPADQPKPTR